MTGGCRCFGPVRVSTTYWGTRPEPLRVLELAARGDLVAETTAWPLSQGLDAYAALRAGTVRGRAVVIPDALTDWI